jgi:hypothetical protein
MSRDIDSGKLTSPQLDNQLNIELDKPDGWNHEQIHVAICGAWLRWNVLQL